jgi:hypothetical protein
MSTTILQSQILHSWNKMHNVKKKAKRGNKYFTKLTVKYCLPFSHISRIRPSGLVCFKINYKNSNTRRHFGRTLLAASSQGRYDHSIGKRRIKPVPYARLEPAIAAFEHHRPRGNWSLFHPYNYSQSCYLLLQKKRAKKFLCMCVCLHFICNIHYDGYYS